MGRAPGFRQRHHLGALPAFHAQARGARRRRTSITYIALAGFLIASAILPFYWKSPASLLDASLFISLGVFGGFGHYFIVRAYELAPAAVVTPFNYGQLLGAAVLSYAVFIVAAGISMTDGERQR